MSTNTKLAEALRLGQEGAPATEDERLLFEAWMRGHCWALCATWNGTQYVSDAEQGGNVDPRAMNTRQIFAAWRDRGALAALAAHDAEQAQEPVSYLIRARWPDRIEEYLEVRGVTILGVGKVGIDVDIPKLHPFGAAPVEQAAPTSKALHALQEIATHSTDGRARQLASAAITAEQAVKAVPSEVWEAASKTSSMLFHTRAEAEAWLSQFAPSVAGGFEVHRRDVHHYPAAPEAAKAVPAVLKFSDGAELVGEGPHWSFRHAGNHIRYLDRFETEFIRAAIQETPQAAPEAQPSSSGVSVQAPGASSGVSVAQQAGQPHTEFVLNELRSALNAMLTFFGMDEDESNKEVFDKARQAYDYAQIVMRPLEPWERQALEDFRSCVGRWHKKAVEKGYDGVESMCDTAPAPAQRREPLTVPYPGSPEASAMIDSELAARGWPSNTKNAARAGYLACCKLAGLDIGFTTGEQR